ARRPRRARLARGLRRRRAPRAQGTGGRMLDAPRRAGRCLVAAGRGESRAALPLTALAVRDARARAGPPARARSGGNGARPRRPVDGRGRSGDVRRPALPGYRRLHHLVLPLGAGPRPARRRVRAGDRRACARTGLEGRALIRWNRPGVVVGFTTRLGGVSEGAYASLNLGRLTRDPQENVDENRRRACAEPGAEADALPLNRQV